MFPVRQATRPSSNTSNQNAERKKTWAELGALRIGIPSANFRKQIAEFQFEQML